jgi:CheY-like chemotaxis protein
VTKPWQILLAEDNRADASLIQEAVEAHGLAADLHVVEDGEDVVSFLDRTDAEDDAPCPDLLLLDLHLPKRNGDEILARLRRSPKCGHIPVLVMTSTFNDEDRTEATRLGAAAFFAKVSDLKEFLKIGESIRRLLETK